MKKFFFASSILLACSSFTASAFAATNPITVTLPYDSVSVYQYPQDTPIEYKFTVANNLQSLPLNIAFVALLPTENTNLITPGSALTINTADTTCTVVNNNEIQNLAGGATCTLAIDVTKPALSTGVQSESFSARLQFTTGLGTFVITPNFTATVNVSNLTPCQTLALGDWTGSIEWDYGALDTVFLNITADNNDSSLDFTSGNYVAPLNWGSCTIQSNGFSQITLTQYLTSVTLTMDSATTAHISGDFNGENFSGSSITLSPNGLKK